MDQPAPAPMPYIVAGGIKVFFPFQPYDTQKQYMSKVVESIQRKHNALLESPTGTGKTLSLLCASLAWQQAQGGMSQKMIYYTSRTHLQLSQAAKEMKKTAYARVPAVVIGSRAQMCINDEVKQQPSHLINRSCQNAIARNACSYHTNYEQKLETIDQNQVHDIEDLHQFARSHQCCPYFASKKLAETKASIVFMPYNYLLDISLRKSSMLRLENSVVIFDEAHNIESSLIDAASGSFKESCLKTIEDSCLQLPSKVSDALHREKHGLSRLAFEPKEKTAEEASKSKGKEKEPKPNRIAELAEKLTNDKIQQVNQCAQLLVENVRELKFDEACTIETIYHLLKKSRIEYSTANHITDTLDSMIAFWSIAGVVNVNQVSKFVVALDRLNHMILLLYPDGCLSVSRQLNHEATLKQAYTAYLKGMRKEGVVKNGLIYDWELNVWCLHPKIGLDRIFEETCLTGPRSLIITSGTLSPLNAIAKSLGREFKCTESFSHVIEDKQLKIITVTKTAKDLLLENTFKYVNSKPKYSEQLGNTLLPILASLPFGTLVFFSSYFMMDMIMKGWTKTREWAALSKICTIFKETSDKESFESNLAAYKRSIGPPKDLTGGKAIFIGVCRGKLSEGINLEGNHCRTVVMVGVPYPSTVDPQVVATRKFNEDNNNKAWYSEQMRRALNQTIGRVIRSKDDFGMLILCDARYNYNFKLSISQWAQTYFPTSGTPPQEVDTVISDFFATHGIVVEKPNLHDFLPTAGSSAFELDPLRPNPRSVFQNNQQANLNQQLTRSKETNGSLVTTGEDRFNQIRQAYTVDRETLERVRRAQEARAADPASGSSQDNGETAVANQRPATTTDIYDQIMNSQGAIFSNNPNRLNSQGSSARSQTSQEPLSKRSRTSDAIFSNSTTAQVQTQGSEYSILELDPDRPSKYCCYICRNEAVRPRATNCKCARVGCEDCLKVLNKKPCGNCSVVFKTTKFKPRLFHSAFSRQERLTQQKDK